MFFCEIASLMHLRKSTEKTNIVLLKGQNNFHFEHLITNILDTNDSELTENDLIALVIEDIG
jgi:hypothetical protein